MDSLSLLGKLRNDIDTVDNQIIKLLEERQSMVEAITMVKSELVLKTYQPDREKSIKNRLKTNSSLDPNLIEQIWCIILDNSKKFQEKYN